MLPILAQMSAPSRAALIFPQPLLDVGEMSSMGAPLTPHVQPLHHLMANTAQRVLGRVTSVAQPSDPLQRLTAFTAVRVYPGRLLVQLVDRRNPRQLYHLRGDIPQLVTS